MNGTLGEPFKEEMKPNPTTFNVINNYTGLILPDPDR